MKIIACTPGTLTIEKATVMPIGEGFATVIFIIHATVHHHFALDNNIMIMGLPFTFNEAVVLCVPNDRIFFSIYGTIRCSAVLINDELIIVNVTISKVLNAVSFENILVPSYSLDLPSQSKTNELYNDVEINVNCLRDFVAELSAHLQSLPSPRATALCPVPNARTRGFWGTGRGGIRMLIDMGKVSFDKYANEILVPIVDPGDKSPFLNNFSLPPYSLLPLTKLGYIRGILLYLINLSWE